MILDWEHEPFTFWFEEIKRGTNSYKPDYKVYPPEGGHYWVEVKGYYDAKSLTKKKRMAKYFPEETIKYIDAKWFKKNNEKMRIIIKGWERG